MEGGTALNRFQTLVAKLRRNFITIIFPVLTAWAIYADWSHTQKYKAAKTAALLQGSEENQSIG